MNVKLIPVYDVAKATDGFQIRRDALPLKTPAGFVFAVPTAALADNILAEWRAQGEKIKPETMPLTQLAMTALDIISVKKDVVVASLAAYAGSDLLCHREVESSELADKQAALWQPWLDWVERNYGARLQAGQGIMPLAQPPEALTKLRQAVAAYDAFHLAGLQQAVSLSGSLILGLALAERAAAPEQIFECAELETLFQIEKWGIDPVTEGWHNALRRDLDIGAKWFGLLG